MSNKIKFVSIGADPEVFLSKNGIIVPCIDIIGGSKRKALVVSEMLSVLEDNVCLEWNMTPSFSKEEFVTKCNEAITIIREHVVPDGYNIEIKSLHEFTEEDLTSRAAKEFGCEADISAYTLRMNPSPDSKTLFRAAGGHLHFGVSGLTQRGIVDAVRLCDAIIGTYCVMNEESSHRRKIYGAAGSFREKDYGFEYRTPSNFWVDSPEHIGKLYDLAELVFSLLGNGITVDSSDLNRIQDCVNSHNVSLSKRIHEKYLKIKIRNEEAVNTSK